MPLERIKNRLRWLAAGVVPSRNSRPMTFVEATLFAKDIGDDVELTSKEEELFMQGEKWELVKHLMETPSVDLPLNY